MDYFAARTRVDPISTSGQAAPPPPSAPDVTRLVTEGLMQPVLQGLSQAATNLSDSMAGLSAPGVRRPEPVAGRGHHGHHHHHHDHHDHHHHDHHHHDHHGHGCDCGCCDCCDCCDCCNCGCCCYEDPCHCRCCIVDADLVVYARLGEQRVVPLTVENRWRRERQIKMELGEFTRRGGGKAPVTAKLMPPAPEFELGPCAQQDVVMVFTTNIGSFIDSGAKTAKARKAEAEIVTFDRYVVDTKDELRRLPDVDDCEVYYADLKVEGCDLRPIRIALAVLPRDCSSYDIECRCRCC